MIELRYKLKGSWTALEKRLVAPLADIAAYWLEAVRARVSETGVGSRGPFSLYQSHSDARFWVPPGEPQPRAAKYGVKEGRFAGWAIYPTRDVYLRLTRKKGRPHTFKAKGDFWASVRATAVTPQHVQIRPVGSTKGGYRFDRLARKLIGPERQGLLTPTAEEWAVMLQMYRDSISAQLSEAAGIASETQALRRATTKAQRKFRTIAGRMTTRSTR